MILSDENTIARCATKDRMTANHRDQKERRRADRRRAEDLGAVDDAVRAEHALGHLLGPRKEVAERLGRREADRIGRDEDRRQERDVGRGLIDVHTLRNVAFLPRLLKALRGRV